MENKIDYGLKTPIKAISSIQTDQSDYRINASETIKHNSSIKKIFNVRSRNFKSYLMNFHYNSYNVKKNDFSYQTISLDNKNTYKNISHIDFNKSMFIYNKKSNLNIRNIKLLKNNNYNNFQTISYSNYKNETFIPPIVKSSGQQKLFKKNYGRIKIFEDNIKEMRYEKYIKHILKNELYFKKSEGAISSQLLKISNYGKETSEKLYNSYYESFKQYSKLLNRILDVEIKKNENKKLIENKLRNQIMRLKIKKEKMFKEIKENMEIKHFLLYVKNKTFDLNKFNEIDKETILYDIERKKLILNDYISKKIINIFSKKSFENRNSKTKTFIHRSSKFLSNNNIRDNRRRSTKIISSNEYKPVVNKKIFNNVDEFDNQYLILSEEIKESLKIYNKNVIELEKLKIKLRNMNEKNEKDILKSNKLNKEFQIHLEKIQIEKNKYENLMLIKKNISTSISKKEKELLKMYKQKINLIFNYIDLNYKKYKKRFIYNENDFRLQIIEQLDFIEKILIELIQKTNKLIKENPNKYKELIKILISRNKNELFLKNKKEQEIKNSEKFEKIKKRMNKIYFLPYKNFQEKFQFSSKNFYKRNKSAINVNFNQELFQSFEI